MSSSADARAVAFRVRVRRARAKLLGVGPEDLRRDLITKIELFAL